MVTRYRVVNGYHVIPEGGEIGVVVMVTNSIILTVAGSNYVSLTTEISWVDIHAIPAEEIV